MRLAPGRQRGQRPGFLPAQPRVADAENPPAADGGQAALAGHGDVRADDEPFAGHDAERFGQAQLDHLPLAAGHLGLFQHGHVARTRRRADVQLHFEVILDRAP